MADESINILLLDQLIQHQVYLERYKKGQLAELQTFLRKLTEDVTGLLGQRLDPDSMKTVRNARLEALLQDLGRLSDASAKAMTDYTQSQLRDLTSYESGFVVATARTLLPVVVEFSTIAPVQLWAAVTAKPFQGRLLETWVQDYSAAQKARLEQAVRTSVVEGETIDQAIRRVRGTAKLGGADGVIPGITRRSAEALVRTAINHTVTTAREATYADNQAMVKGVQWRSTLDGKTSLVCISRDGQMYPLDSGPRPPAHPNCRSTTVPVLKSWKELGINLDEAPEGTRASMDGQVPASETYQTWLKRQPFAFQDDVLGPSRANLFRSGKLTVDKFTDEKGHIYTLDELRARHPAAF